MTLATGTKLGRYEISSQLGVGGMGEVYLAEDIGTNFNYSPSPDSKQFALDGGTATADIVSIKDSR